MATTVNTPLLLLSIFFIFTCVPIFQYSFSCPSHQKQALLHFKFTLTTIITSTSYHLKSWNPNSDCCSWERVNCTQTKTHVTELHLDGVIFPILPSINPPPPVFYSPVFSGILAPLFQIRSLKKLDISNNSLLGEIPGDGFGNLTELVRLNMQFNRFNGSIPRQLYRLTNLRHLDMSYNILQGKLGPELGSFRKLTTLNLAMNGFQGPVPSQLFKLESLRVLDLSYNILEGELAPELGQLRNLNTLWLSGNRFHGPIPRQLFELKSLQNLGLGENFLNGALSPELGTFSNMTTLYMGYNKFTGQIPSSMQNLSKLEAIILNDNMLSGEIPTWLLNFTTLKALHIGGKGSNLIWNNKAKIVPRCSLKEISMPYCGISGQIPEWVSYHKDLVYLDLIGNTLEGRFTEWLAEMDLQIISLSGNNLIGSIPLRIFDNVHLMFLDLSQNSFSGELPQNIGNATRLNALVLSENKFSGQIPMSISMIKSLQYLDLSRNRFLGEDLQLFGDESNLLLLDLSYNNFSGKIPSNFPKVINRIYLGGNKFSGNLTWNLTKLFNLVLLDIHENNITGNFHDILPLISPNLRVLILRNNSLEGYIPSNISSLRYLQILDLSHNNLGGNIPREISNILGMIQIPNISSSFRIPHGIIDSTFEPGELIVNWKKSFQGLAYRNLISYSLLDLSHNRIFGEIPSSLGKLKALKVLNISHNMLSGHIPTSLGDLNNIESLDLSHNEISGQIPQSLLKLVQLTVLDVSNNKLTGKIPVGGQMNTMNELSFENNSGLCGMQIRVKCLEDFPTVEEVGEENEKQSWFSLEGIWFGFLFGFFSSILMIWAIL